MLKQVAVEIEEDEVVVASLTDTLGYIENSIEQSYCTNPQVFSCDPVEDLKQLKKFRKALKKVIDWYTP